MNSADAARAGSAEAPGRYADEREVPVSRIPPPATLRCRSTLGRIDYADSFVVETRRLEPRSGLEWARLVFDRAPASTRLQLSIAWRALGLRLGREARRTSVLGWPVRSVSDDHVLLSARSRLAMPAELLVERRQDDLLLATMIRFDSPWSAAFWRGFASVHQDTVRRVLADMHRRAVAADLLATGTGQGGPAGRGEV